MDETNGLVPWDIVTWELLGKPQDRLEIIAIEPFELSYLEIRMNKALHENVAYIEIMPETIFIHFYEAFLCFGKDSGLRDRFQTSKLMIRK
jgi:hypothetical protein